MRYGIKVVFAIRVVAAVTSWFVLSEFGSERYYVVSNLHINGWDLRTIGENELDQMLFGKESESFYLSNTTDGITTSAKRFGDAFSTDSTRWPYTQAAKILTRRCKRF